MFPRSLISLAICLSGIIYVSSVFAQSKTQAGETSGREAQDRAVVQSAGKAQVMVLGMYHFTAKNDMHNLDSDDVLAAKRQAEITDVVARLRAFNPTKIVIEAPYGDVKKNRQYAEYLAGKYTLTGNEVDQIGFRLAKELKHKQLYPVDLKTPFNYGELLRFAKENDQTGITSRAEDGLKKFVGEINELQKRASVLEMLQAINTERFINANHQTYLIINVVGKDANYIGADLVSEWYKRNLLIFANIQRLIESPTDRVLIIYGQGHAKLLRQFIQDSPDMELVEVSKYL
jgi:hypothetical protein